MYSELDKKNKRNLIKRIGVMHGIEITDRMIQAFINVPREEFVLERDKNSAYVDSPRPILAGQTISAIHMVIMYISPSLSDPKEGDIVLEVGAGSGYNAALFAEMVAPKGSSNPGHVYALEIIPELVEFARENIERTGYSDRVTIIHADGGIGYPEKAPFDIISVAAASKGIPEPLKEQLKVGGRMIIPVGTTFFQELILIRKESSGNFSQKNICGVRFVPLTGKYG
ncbi:MAG: protein-L-isoaspartate(D-aspartate) O-methyltransferase [Candidatus Heimdallarchaeum aukensis]|uniref:Protein-L-isoaspartate O-methyltransferase n=1 Tax=Candidatus Heimdallarchaeum aukensis TaxID=2876573 RepID=A0A9Y1BJW9_9ARCH|nr:MAG: protein-L-isoaspartate(D-aspartate) O-methyltransferase [Candidatus Heimdallarchaeum aukensis]